MCSSDLEATDDRKVPIGIDSIANLLGNGLHGLKIVVGDGGEAGLDYVDIELGELPCQVFPWRLERRQGLLAIVESGVKDANVVRVRDAIGVVIGAVAGGRCGCGSGV